MAVSEETEVFANRLSKPGLRDPRFLIGLLLIGVSILGVIAMIRATNHNEQFYVANKELHVGDRLTSADLVSVDMNLNESSHIYLTADELEGDHLVTDNIPQGGLIQVDDIATVDELDRQEVTLVLDSTVANTLHVGDYVDIWISTKSDSSQGYEEPKVVMHGAEISDVTNEESVIGSTGKSAVRILVNTKTLTPILGAINNEDKINLVPSQSIPLEK